MTFAWSFYSKAFVLYLVLQVAWTILIRTFPDFIGGALLRGIESRSAKKIEDLKADHSRRIEQLKARLDHLRDRSARSNEREFRAIESMWHHFVDAYAATMRCAIAFNQHPDFGQLSADKMREYLASTDLSDRQRDMVMNAADKNQAFSRCVEMNQINGAGKAIYDARNEIRKQAIFIPDDLRSRCEEIIKKLSTVHIERSIETHYGQMSTKSVEWLLEKGEADQRLFLCEIRNRLLQHEQTDG